MSRLEEFKEQVRNKLEDKSAMDILDISSGYIFDAILDNYDDETYTDVSNGIEVTISTMAKPDGVNIVAKPYSIELTLLSEPMVKNSIFSPMLITNNPYLVDVMAAVLDVTNKLMVKHDLTPSTLDAEWDG